MNQRGSDLEEGTTPLLAPADRGEDPQPRLTSDDKETAPVQPREHSENKGLAEKLCACCCASRLDLDLNKREARYYNKFKELVVDYDKENPEHEFHVKLLYQKAFKTEEVKSEENRDGFTMVNDDWKDLGFQGRNPRTDFRGGGHLSLLCLLYTIDKYPGEWDDLVSCTKNQESLMWLTAISSINMTHSLVIYFFMNKGDVAP